MRSSPHDEYARAQQEHSAIRELTRREARLRRVCDLLHWTGMFFFWVGNLKIGLSFLSMAAVVHTICTCNSGMQYPKGLPELAGKQPIFPLIMVKSNRLIVLIPSIPIVGVGSSSQSFGDLIDFILPSLKMEKFRVRIS